MTIKSDLRWKLPILEALDRLVGEIPIPSEIRAALEARSPVVISLSVVRTPTRCCTAWAICCAPNSITLGRPSDCCTVTWEVQSGRRG